MAREIEIVILHALGAVGAHQRLLEGIEALKSEFGKYTSSLHEQWRGADLDFKARAMGSTASGSVHVTETEVQIRCLVPLLLRPFAGKIKRYVEQNGPEFFA